MLRTPEQIISSLPLVVGEKKSKAIQTTQHPLGPLTASEILESSRLIKQEWPSITDVNFKAITLRDPKKAGLAPYLEAERIGQKSSSPARKSFVLCYLRKTDKLHEAIVNLSTSSVESNLRLGQFVHSNSDGSEIIEIEEICLDDERVQADIAKLKLPEGAVAIGDTWIDGSDGVNEGEFSDTRRLYQCFLYLRDPNYAGESDNNHYAMPLTTSHVNDCKEWKIIRIDFLSTGIDNTTKEPSKYKVQPLNEYISEAQTLCTDVKPLKVIHLEGASFRVSNFCEQGQAISRQKWEFKVGFNQREGMVLYDVHYAGRPLFYRPSLPDMAIPNADPRHPFHKKQAFDLGDFGAGIMANNLQLGCDYPGSIHYLSPVLSNDKRASVRNRELVLQSIITVSNYEYILAFQFNQAGEIMYEAHATGILSPQPIDEVIEVPWGTVVHPGVLATHHQHIFSLRVDPMIGGSNNRVDFNPHGIGYTVKETPITTSGGYDLIYDVNRTLKIQNKSVKNPINDKPVAYKIHVPKAANKDSFHFRRAEFADHNIYVTSHQDKKLYAGGKYTNQSRGGTGVRSWAERKDNVLDDNLVVWVQFGINHVPRSEDFPVMPCEIVKLSLKPVNFFEKNPALDEPHSTQSFDGSVLLSAHGGEDLAAKIDGKVKVYCVKETSKL
ncbi:copper amine oxidase [Calycina marina]|uniref:Amine oxidase n=1 Tax=Calycina marina TaxID=1763456 RepID=A0A9P8CI19_9HELO|nr:copper amine oxidase [Calycina marina]